DSRKGEHIHSHLAKFTKIRITALDFAETFGIDSKIVYSQLKTAADNLFERQLSIKTNRRGNERITRFRWVTSASYAESEGFIEVSFSPEIYPHLQSLKSQYTTYKLQNAAAFRSVYSWRLFEIARSWLGTNKPVKLSLENIRHQLDVPTSYKWNDVKKRALDPAILEISKHEKIDITYTTKKSGRSVSDLIFTFKKREKLDLLIDI
uniref:replication initiation protein n=1 Tax=Vibrio hibernica TaxID=2587465 RepID=UPI0018802EB0